MQPTQFGNYTLLERISHGGMAEVFRAKTIGEAGFEREVALKLLLPNIAMDDEFVTMLIDEAKIAGQLNHANIAQIFDLGMVDGRYYIVQEYVRGRDMRAILKDTQKNRVPLAVATSCYIALKVCEGLHYAHNCQDNRGRPMALVHRDISPHNVLLSDEGEVKIIDFGIAKANNRTTQTLAGLVKGKFAYMSPEQIRGLPVDHRSDVFATGILLHEMLANRSLFRRESEFETLKLARSARADPPSRFNSQVSSALDAIVLKALARHVDDRYQNAREFRDALWTFAREHDAFATAPVARTTPPVEILAPAMRDALSEITKGGSTRPAESQAAGIDPETMPEPPRLRGSAAADFEEDNATIVDPQMTLALAQASRHSAPSRQVEEDPDTDVQSEFDERDDTDVPDAPGEPSDTESLPGFRDDEKWAENLRASAYVLPSRGRVPRHRGGPEETTASGEITASEDTTVAGTVTTGVTDSPEDVQDLQEEQSVVVDHAVRESPPYSVLDSQMQTPAFPAARLEDDDLSTFPLAKPGPHYSPDERAATAQRPSQSAPMEAPTFPRYTTATPQRVVSEPPLQAVPTNPKLKPFPNEAPQASNSALFPKGSPSLGAPRSAPQALSASPHPQPGAAYPHPPASADPPRSRSDSQPAPFPPYGSGPMGGPRPARPPHLPQQASHVSPSSHPAPLNTPYPPPYGRAYPNHNAPTAAANMTTSGTARGHRSLLVGGALFIFLLALAATLTLKISS